MLNAVWILLGRRWRPPDGTWSPFFARITLPQLYSNVAKILPARLCRVFVPIWSDGRRTYHMPPFSDKERARKGERVERNWEEETNAMQHELFTPPASSGRRLGDKLPASFLTYCSVLICKSARFAEKTKLTTCRTICLSLSHPISLPLGRSVFIRELPYGTALQTGS